MKAKEDLMSTALSRIGVVQAYLSYPFPAEKFLSLYNSGGVNRHLLKDTGPLTVVTLLRWAEKCLAVTSDIENTPISNPCGGYVDAHVIRSTVHIGGETYFHTLLAPFCGQLVKVERTESGVNVFDQKQCLICAELKPDLVVGGSINLGGDL
jgi:hypothetical protein